MNSPSNRYDSTVEVAHTYAPDYLAPLVGWRDEQDARLPIFGPPSEYHTKLAELGLRYSDSPRLVGFVDDIGQPELTGLMTELSVMETLPGNPDVYRESDYVEPAQELVERIRGMDLPEEWRLSADRRRVVYGHGNGKLRIPLVGFSRIDDPEHPSCQVLDLAWTLDRLQSVAPNTATILPDTFARQQVMVSKLAALIPEMRHATVTTILTDLDGDETSRFKWDMAA